MKIPNPKVETWPLSRLKDHPLQASTYGDITGAEFDLLVEDIRLHGQRDRADVMPDGTILHGHQRCRALLVLGRKIIKVKVRHDLEALGGAACDIYFLTANATARKLSHLQVGRIYRAMQKLQPAKRAKNGEGKLVDNLAAKYGISSRKLQRLAKVATTPDEVQAAVESKQISMSLAERVADLDAAGQRRVVAALSHGDASAVKRLAGVTVPQSDRKPASTMKMLQTLRTVVQAALEQASSLQSLLTPQDRQQLRKLAKSLGCRPIKSPA